jgi:restriction endonuclease S subunit
VTDNWPTLQLGTLLVDIQPGFASGQHNSEGRGIPHFRPMNVSIDGRIDRTVMKYVDPTTGRADIRLCRGDILFNNTNSPELVGKTALFDEDDSPAFSNHMTRLRVDSSRLDAHYAALRLHQAWREGWFAAHCNNHVSQASIGRDVLKGFRIELPPLDVQRAIVSISTLIDDGRLSASAHVLAARHAVEQFRRGVVAFACSGRLTADWRSSRGIRDNDKLPGGWESRTFDYFASSIRGGSTEVPQNESTQYPILRSSSVRPFHIDFDDVRYLNSSKPHSPVNFVQNGDLLVTRLSGSVDYVGNCAMVKSVSEPRAQYPDRLFCCRLKDQREAPYIELCFAGPAIRKRVEQASRSAAGHQRISISDLRSVPIDRPPLAEQGEIVRRSTALLGAADTLLERIESVATHLDRAPQAVLAKAFRGELNSAFAESDRLTARSGGDDAHL